MADTIASGTTTRAQPAGEGATAGPRQPHPDRPTRRAPKLGRNGPWLRWSWRDLRARWVQVLVIAVVAALGTGTYVGLTATTQWRRQSYDASYAALNAHSLEVSLATGTAAPADALLRATQTVAHPEWITAATPQLVVPAQVDASANGKTILVPGRIVGVDVSRDQPPVDRFDVRAGRGLTRNDVGTGAVVLDRHFAQAHDLPPTGTVRVSGDRTLEYKGHVLQPEYFMIMSDQGSFLAEAGYAVLFTPLEDAQALAGKGGGANRLVLTLAPGVDPRDAQRELEVALGATLPDSALEVAPITTETSYRILYDDIDGDQRFYRIFAVLILAGAAFAAFNLASRIVEAQRREIGVGMALGVPPKWLAFRPLLVGMEVALLSTLLGIGVGILIGNLMSGLLRQFFPMPVWNTPFELSVYLQGAIAAIVLLFLATVFPVARAVRVAPIDAIRVGLRETKPSGWANLVQRLPLPGNSLVQMPVRNTLRSPRRSILTALGIAAAIATLVAIIGMVDSFLTTIDRGERELAGATPDRMLVGLDGFQLTGAPVLQTMQDIPGVESTSASLRVPGTAGHGDTHLDVVVDLMDLHDPIWAPPVTEGSADSDEPAVVLSRKAADDLGVGPGGTIRLRHPYREGLGYRWVESDIKVSGIHSLAYRFMAFVDIRHASMMNLTGVVNQVNVRPKPGTAPEDLQRALFHHQGVASVQPVAAITSVIRDRIGQFLDVLEIIEIAVLLLAVLIAFNSSSISADERRREHATMFAFGVRTRTVLAMAVAESALIGAAATLLGIVAGRALLGWIVGYLLTDTMPDLTVDIDVSRNTYLLAVLLGVVAVALAPLFNLRKLRRMKVSETLRVVE